MRKMRAFTIAAITGQTVLYEDDQGNLCEITMPKSDPIFLFRMP